jgi:ribonuclease T
MAANPELTARRFRGFLPVVVDVETGGFRPQTDALLEIAAVIIEIGPDGRVRRGPTHAYHVKPFEGSRLDPASLEVTGIDPWHPLRPAIDEADALQRLFRDIRTQIRSHGCRRAILVGHNAAFDLAFLNAAVERTGIKRNPFHPFSCFDTATLAGAALGQTVLARAVQLAGTTGTGARRIQRAMTPNAPRTCSATSTTCCTSISRAPRKRRARSDGRTAPRRRWT